MVFLEIYEEICKRIWQAYKLYCGTAFVSRSGFELVGLTKATDDAESKAEKFVRRGESSLEHQAKVAWLCSVFSSNFPGFFGKRQFNESRIISSDWILMTTGLSHDIGEVVLGDIPDDGNPLHDTKDAKESEVFQKMLQGYDDDDRVALLAAFTEFQDKSTHAGKALFTLDKLDAVLTLILMEMYGRFGSIASKPAPTDSDIHFWHETGTPSATDCWCAHMKSLIRDFPDAIVWPVDALLTVAIRDARGKNFSWWGRDIPNWQPK